MDKILEDYKEAMNEEDVEATLVVMIKRDGTILHYGIGQNDISDINSKLLAAKCAEMIGDIAYMAQEMYGTDDPSELN